MLASRHGKAKRRAYRACALSRDNISDPNNLVYGDSRAANRKSLRLKASYIYRVKYGVSLTFFKITGSTDSVACAGSVALTRQR
jgi:hypothetical protein